ncbi:uncharacterized protein LOC130075794 [Rhinichthys klamathensis goyatoka]|uniref:uncharacterized protein LOC130075794 n=1 Tax=Rhinichthys klamathensis goyatoka TaxID=3034132 RepID=UPI0024B4FD3C|nr:uncharacterized protein LOC130075794 [Rhinichthys klamathensis goyatoka]
MLSRAAEKVGLAWNPPPRPEPSRLDDWFLGAGRAGSQCAAPVPFFPEVHEELSKTWKAPYSARSRPSGSSPLATLDGGAAKGYVGIPPVERAVAMQLCPASASSWRGDPRLPSKACKFSSGLTARAYKACGQAASALHAMALLQVHQAQALMDMNEGGSDPELFRELRVATDLALRATKETARSVGQAMSTLVVQERHLWLNLADMRDTDKYRFLDAPLSQRAAVAVSWTHYRLRTLTLPSDGSRLSGCMVTERGCCFLASALSSNPSHLRELDLSYNHPGQSLVNLLSDPNYRLDKLNLDHGGKFRTTKGLKKYACDLTLDLNTANTRLALSERNSKMTRVEEEQPFPDRPERFDEWPQVLCRESLTGRCYWETEWSKWADISVTYKGICRRGHSDDCGFGLNEKSWSLNCFINSFTVRHNNESISAHSHPSNRVGVYLDWPAGTLSFYSVSKTHTLTHLHTFNSTFTEPLYAGFGVHLGGSVSLCEIKPLPVRNN